MAVELIDLLGVLSVVAYLMGIGAITVRAVLLRREQRTGRGWLVIVLVALAVAYTGMVLLDAPGVLTILTNGVDDIPPTSTLRTGFLAGFLWVLHSLLLRVATGRPT